MSGEGSVSSNKKESIPARCLSCDNYRPTFLKTAGKECAYFTTIAGADTDHCWAWRQKPPAKAD